MIYPESEELKNRLKKVVEEGWQEDNGELEEILAENESSFEEFRKGLLLKKCDFTLGKEYKYLIEKEAPPLLSIRNLSNMLILKGRYYEHKGQFDKAIDTYLSCLAFAQHIHQDNSSIAKLVAMAIEEAAYKPIRQYLNSEGMQQKEALRILEYLSDYEKQYFPARQIIEDEKRIFISTMKMLADDVKEKADKDGKIKEGEYLAEELMRQAHELGDKYYGNFVKAIESNKETDWEFAANELKALGKNSKGIVGDIKYISNLIYNVYTQNVKGTTAITARKVIGTMIVIGMPDFKLFAKKYYTSLGELKEIISLAKTKVEE